MYRKLRNQKGFTLIEIMIVFAICFIIGVVFIAGIYRTLLKGNFWYTDEGVLKALQFERPNVTKILKTERNAWDYSRIIVQEEDFQKIYYLDTNILFNYEFQDDCE